MNENHDEISYKSPIYIQLRDLIRKKIDEGEYLPGTSIPSENELASMYGINRLTVRNAMSKLVNEGLLKRIQGKGVYVVPQKIERDLDKLGGFKQLPRSKRSAICAEVQVKAVRKAGDKFSCIFGIQPEDEIYYVKQVNSLESGPFSFDEIYLPKFILPNLQQIDLSIISLRQAYASNGITISHSRQILDLTYLEQNDARTLGIVPNVAVMLFESTSYDNQDHIVEFAHTYTRSDKCEFYIRFYK